MICTSRQVVWTPIIGRDSLAVALDRTFAEACIAHKLQDMKSFVEGVWKFAGNKSPTPSGFLDIYNGVLPKGFYAGNNGLWLTIDITTVSGTRQPFMYHGYNEEMLADRFWLLNVFQAWADVALIILDWK